MPYLLCLMTVLVTVMSMNTHATISKGKRIYQGWDSSYYRNAAGKSCPSYCDSIKFYSDLYSVPENLVISIIKNESSFNAKAVSPKGAKGLMQLMDFNSQKYNIDPFNPSENIKGGTQMIASLIAKYDDLSIALAAYNAGEGNVSKYNGIPPFKETQTYVKRVINYYEELNRAK
ncbi:lytic transglycosylase domain-containing protein [Vibrio coralliilyticus]|uniref:lytic transglycosylase domain-containing protein n=1 Tax=Vibrio coralliilyticus TaxID=190893 RepID=UPI000C172097|nr:lytic transglycosylase domain-containing protein [Vibrio coralliilyticus]